MKRKSIIQDRRECFLCGRTDQLQTHHCIHGVANRKYADQDGLTVYLCIRCHTNLHSCGTCDLELKQIAQRMWCRYYRKTSEDFRERYGKTYV